jgi:DNA-binding beta-propeller fold protein YncE
VRGAASRMHASALALAAAALAVNLPAAGGTLPFTVAHRIALAGTSPVGSLAFAPDGKLAYAAAGDTLRSFEVRTGAPADVLKLPGQVVGLAASSDDGGTVYVAVRAPAQIMFLGMHPLHVRASVPIRGGAPAALLYEPGEHSFYVESRAGHSVTRLDSGNGKTIAVGHLKGDLEQMAGDGHGTVYVANSSSDAIDVLAADKMTSLGGIPTPDCHAPTGLDLDPVGRRLFVACGNGRALVVDTDMGFAFEQLPIQHGTALRTVFAFHPNGPGGWKGGAFIAGDGPELDAIRMNAFISYTGAGAIPLSGRATALAVNPAAGQIWIALAPTDGATPANDAQRSAGVEIRALTVGGGSQ